MIYFELFWSFFKVGLFSIGGGYAALPFIQDEIIVNRGYLNLTEFTDILTISQMTPGPIAINVATFVGTKMAEILGAIWSTLGFVAPSFIIVLTFSYFFFKYNSLAVVTNVLTLLKPVVVGIIASVAVDLFVKSIINLDFAYFVDFKAMIIFAVCSYLLFVKKVKILATMPVSAILGIILYAI